MEYVESGSEFARSKRLKNENYMRKFYNQQTQQNSSAIANSLRNDYSQFFLDTGMRPQNFIRDIEPEKRFDDYPKLKELIRLKNQVSTVRAHPPVYLKADIRKADLSELGKFDVVLIDPPWMEYKKRASGYPLLKQCEKLEGWNFEDISNIDIPGLTEIPSFVFLWVGSEHLDEGRQLLKLWGFKRCEDIVWLKTNSKNPGLKIRSENILQHVKEHCLVGVKGDVRRANDSHFIHANIDTDVIVDEEHDPGNMRKPEELYDIIERFCLGRKKLELFSDNQSIRRGWLSLGKDIVETSGNLKDYDS